MEDKITNKVLLDHIHAMKNQMHGMEKNIQGIKNDMQGIHAEMKEGFADVYRRFDKVDIAFQRLYTKRVDLTERVRSPSQATETLV